MFTVWTLHVWCELQTGHIISMLKITYDRYMSACLKARINSMEFEFCLWMSKVSSSNNPGTYIFSLKFMHQLTLLKVNLKVNWFILHHIIVLEHSQRHICNTSHSKSIASPIHSPLLFQKCLFEPTFIILIQNWWDSGNDWIEFAVGTACLCRRWEFGYMFRRA